LRQAIKNLTLKNCLLNLLGSAILAFGLYHVHARTDITEGGVLGLTLLLYHHFGWSPAITGLIANFACYTLGFFVLGKEFILYSAISGGGFSLFYALFEQFPPLWPEIGRYPLNAAIMGAVFVGVGVGIAVRCGGAPGGDDALAMSLSVLLGGVKIERIYLVSDLMVLALSLTYIPYKRILYSLLTVVLSGQIIGWMQKRNA